jgi:toxin ParE1/3/4
VRVRWLRSAVADLEAIQDYLLDKNPPAAVRLVSQIRAAVARLIDMPQRGRPGRWQDTRELVIPGTPYIVPYRVRGGIIEILRMWHGARRWPPRPPRTPARS